MIVRFSTVPDSPVSPFHSTVNRRLQMLTRGMGLAYVAFVESEEFALILDALTKSDDPEDGLSHHPDELNHLLTRVRKAGYATRASFVEPRNSNTIAVPIISQEGRVLASLGLTYFKSAFATEQEACERFVPILQSAAVAISDDLGRLSKNMSVDVSEFGAI